MATSGVLAELDQRDKLAAAISCNSTKIYRIVSCNKSIATAQKNDIFEDLNLLRTHTCIVALT